MDTVVLRSRIPTGFRLKAQGCAAALPWVNVRKSSPTATRLRPFRSRPRATFATTALRLMICLSMTQGRRWRANLGLEVAIPLGLFSGERSSFLTRHHVTFALAQRFRFGILA